jgi:4,5-DOPA dioxygenase extradiol
LSRIDQNVANVMPTFFLGHGSPMNILAKNTFTENFKRLGQTFPPPKMILCVSAHWITFGTQIQSVENPKQIYDFSGFPQELYKVAYTPKGSPELAADVCALNFRIHSTSDWGLDHGSWAVLHHMYPKQDVPVLQLSLNKNLNPLEHLEVAQTLKPLRQKGVLILGSGNIVHNLRQIQWDENAPAQPWALEFEEYVQEIMENINLASEEKVEQIFSSEILATAHPTIEHLLPLVYNIGVAEEHSSFSTLRKGIQNSSVSMAAFQG